MNLGIRSMVVLAGLIAAHGMLAQAPAGAPAGSNGVCKDGSYSTAATKDGACRGHKGVGTWYGATTTKAGKSPSAAADKPSAAKASAKNAAPAPAAAAAPMPAKSVAQAPAPVPAAAPKPAAQASAPMPSSAPAQNTSNMNMNKPSATRVSESRGGSADKQAAPGGGNGLVWVNTTSNVYHCQGTAFYGKTKAGAYMSESDAKAKGARADAGKPCTK